MFGALHVGPFTISEYRTGFLWLEKDGEGMEIKTSDLERRLAAFWRRF